MLPLSLVLTMAAAPVTVRVDMTDALRLPNGFEAPSPNPLVIFLRAPPSWVNKGALTDAGKKTVLDRLYGGPGWEKGNSDGSTYVVKKFASRVVAAGEKLPNDRGTFWYEVKADGSLDKRGPDFGDPAAPPQPKSLIDSAIPGSVFKQAQSLTDAAAAKKWLAEQKTVVQLAVTLKRGQVGFESRGAKAGALEFRCDDSKLGISLADRAREKCGDAATCQLWLVGHWKNDVFEVTKVDRSVSGAERELGMTNHAWIPE